MDTSVVDDEPVSRLSASSTRKSHNRFSVKIYLFIQKPELTIGVLDRTQIKKIRGVRKIPVTLILEYPTYDEELQMKKEALTLDDRTQQLITDYDKLSYLRVRR